MARMITCNTNTLFTVSAFNHTDILLDMCVQHKGVRWYLQYTCILQIPSVHGIYGGPIAWKALPAEEIRQVSNLVLQVN